jgi:hypothetical protein
VPIISRIGDRQSLTRWGAVCRPAKGAAVSCAAMGVAEGLRLDGREFRVAFPTRWQAFVRTIFVNSFILVATIYRYVLIVEKWCACSSPCPTRYYTRRRAQIPGTTGGAHPLCLSRGTVKLLHARPYRPLPPWQAIGARTCSPSKRPSPFRPRPFGFALRPRTSCGSGRRIPSRRSPAGGSPVDAQIQRPPSHIRADQSL